MISNIDALKTKQADANIDGGQWIKIGVNSCGIAAGAKDIYEFFARSVSEAKLNIDVRQVGCVGNCYAEPLVEVKVDGCDVVIYESVTMELAKTIMDEHIRNKRIVGTPSNMAELQKGQLRVALRNCGVIRPENLDDYIAQGGYQGLAKCLAGTQEQVIEEMKTSGLRGRGGAGFPTWMKWNFARQKQSDQKYIICNGDEGDPGAYMDRGLMEGDPHAVVEGLAIGAYAIGASMGYFYIRAEYPLAVARIQKAIDDARSAGLLGKNIMGSKFSFDIEIRLGAGAFVCGEETALIASMEGRRGTPRPRPPFPSDSGLWGKPTVINNVETLSNVSAILLKGGQWYSSIGTKESTGTKVFAVTGKVKNAKLVEVPMGITLRQVVFDICGGLGSKKPLLAVQTGGPSGGMIVEKDLDTPITYGNLQKLGSIMGSGGMIVMDQSDCVVDVAKFYLGFCVEESCGKCAPCRVGSFRMLQILERISEGKGCMTDLQLLQDIATTMQRASLCGLGQTASNPVLSTLHHFREEYEEHIRDKKCRARKCRKLMVQVKKETVSK